MNVCIQILRQNTEVEVEYKWHCSKVVYVLKLHTKTTVALNTNILVNLWCDTLSFISSMGFHQLWLQVQVGCCKLIVICTVYWLPLSDLNRFDAEFSDALISALSLSPDVYVPRDLNCNLPPRSWISGGHKFCSIFNLTQVINSLQG